MSNVLIVDTDVVLYGSCANRWGSVYNEMPIFTEEEDNAYAAQCITNFNKIISDLSETLFITDIRLPIKGDNNFRFDVYPSYKQNRKSKVRPVAPFIKMLTEYAIQHYDAIPSHGMETDDLVRIFHNEEVEKGNKPIIASIDKDLLCISGTHYRFPKGLLYNGECRDLSRLIEVGEFDAKRHYYHQLLMGDSTDNIPGLPGVGPKRAEAILKDCTTEDELQYMTIYAYKNVMGEQWKEALILTGKLITILPHRDFVFNIDGWKGNE
jgi:Autographiviridae exonuclease